MSKMSCELFDVACIRRDRRKGQCRARLFGDSGSQGAEAGGPSRVSPSVHHHPNSCSDAPARTRETQPGPRLPPCSTTQRSLVSSQMCWINRRSANHSVNPLPQRYHTPHPRVLSQKGPGRFSRGSSCRGVGHSSPSPSRPPGLHRLREEGGRRRRRVRLDRARRDGGRPGRGCRSGGGCAAAGCASGCLPGGMRGYCSGACWSWP